MPDWDDVHTCHDECPCQTGGEPARDFAAAEGAATLMMLRLGIPHAEVAEMVMDARRRSREFPRTLADRKDDDG